MRNDAHLFDPHSYAEETQKKVHQWVNSTDPGGWRHQLNDAPILSFSRTESTPPGSNYSQYKPAKPKIDLDPYIKSIYWKHIVFGRPADFAITAAEQKEK